MSTRRFPNPGILAGLALILLLRTLPATAQPAAGAPSVNVPATSATASAAPPERVLDRADLLPHLNTIRRQYPRLYERLHREVPPEQLQQAQVASTESITTTTAGKSGGAQSAAAPVDGHATTTRTVPLDALLRQDVRARAAPPAPLPGTRTGGLR